MSTPAIQGTKIVTIFRSRLNEEHRPEYATLAPEIMALAK